MFDACFRYVNHFEDFNGEKGDSIPVYDDTTKVKAKTTADSLEFLKTADSLKSANVKDGTKKVQELKIPLNDTVKNNLHDTSKANTAKIDKTHTKIDSASLKQLTKGLKQGKPDSLSSKGITDSLTAKNDTVKIDPMTLDSTARLKYFHYQRHEDPYVKMRNKKPSKFFAQSKTFPVERKIELDSTGEYVEIKESIAGQQTKVLLRLKFDKYLALRMNARNRDLWEEIGYKYEIKKTEKDLGGLIKDFTDFEIPLPSVGVLSIFGTPKISLKIGGSVLIHGAWRNETTEGVAASALGNTRNEPDFKQQVQINVNGTIGDKLQISADWNTERTFEYENQLKIKYTGYPDEIVQSVEAGNVSLQTSNLVGGGEALFGVKAGFKMGPLTLTTIASQKKGEMKEVSVTGGSTTQDFVVRAYDYSKNHFFVDDIYSDTVANLFYKYYGSITPQTSEYEIKDIEVWKSVNTTIKNPLERDVIADIDLKSLEDLGYTKYPDEMKNNSIQAVSGSIVKGRFVRLVEGTDYEVHRPTGYITLLSTPQDQDIIAVAYVTKGGKTYGEFVHTITADTAAPRILLKLVKPDYLLPQYKKAWSRLLKNIYPVGVRDVKQDGFTMDIKYVGEGTDSTNSLKGQRLLNVFGLDLMDASKNPNPDGLFDFIPGQTINTGTGEIIFPVLQPFGRNFPKTLDDSLKYQDVYDTTVTAAKLNREKDKFFMAIRSSGSSSSTFNLGFNIVENSVKVTLDGRQLVAGVDYVVDYNVGQLTLRNSDALVPNANLKITFEQNDLFQLASKTLIGARGLFDFGKTKIGFSALNLSQQTLSDKVRIGEEPLSNSIYGLDLTTSADLPFMTKLLDNFISTKEKSSISFSGEFAYMRPDPNTKKSTIESDNNQSIAYIDDFEGTKKLIPVGVSFTSWHDISIPVGLDTIGGRFKMEQLNYKAKSFWYNITPSPVKVTEIWPDKTVAPGEDQVTVLNFVYRPYMPGMYNFNRTIKHIDSSWGGTMKRLSTTATNLQDENIEYIEFWYKPDSINVDNKMYLNLGKISEDVIPNGELDNEDNNSNELTEDDEDTGLDKVFDRDEKAYALEKFGITDVDPVDPAHDDFYINAGSYKDEDYINANGTEGNTKYTALARTPDTEDLNKNNNLETANAYYEYEIPLVPDSTQNPYLVPSAGAKNHWYLIRVPLKDFKREIGTPSFSNIETVRMYFKNTTNDIKFELAEFNLVGSQWYKTLRDDSLMEVTVVNLEDNANYSIPPGVSREKDRSRPDQNIEKNEQSLNLEVRGLPANTKREVSKTLYKALDVFSYKEMKLFVHGDETDGSVDGHEINISKFIDANHYAADVYFRFGSDSNNYYEYRQPVQRGWNEIDIKFSDLTAIKQGRDSAKILDTLKTAVKDKPGHYYIVKGSPSLTKISVMSIGVYNPPDKNSIGPVYGDVWVNELRVVGADDSPGWAYTAATTIKLADLMNIGFNVNQTDPNFHRLSDRFGSRVDSKSWAFNADLDVIKLIPFDMSGSNLKISYSHSETIAKPKYLPGTDVKVDDAAARLKEQYILMGKTEAEASFLAENLIGETQTLSVSDSWNAASIKIKLPTDFWLIRDTFNSLTFGFNYNKSFNRNPTTLDNTAWVWNASMNYNLNLNPEYYFYPVDIPVFGTILGLFTDYRNAKIYYTPQSVTADITAKRSRGYTTTRAIGSATALPTLVSRDFSSTRGCNVNWKLTEGGIINLASTFSVDISSSLAFLETDQFNQQRSESSIWRDIFSGVFFGRDFTYNQNFDLRTNPKLPALWDINKFFTLSAGYSAKYSWGFDFRQEETGRSAGYDSRLNLQMTVRWKELTEPMFSVNNQTEERPRNNFPQGQTRSRRGDRERVDERERISDKEKNIQNEAAEIQRQQMANSRTISDSLFKSISDTMYKQMPDSLRKIALENLRKTMNDSLRKSPLNIAADTLTDTVYHAPKTPVYETAFYMLKTFSKITFFDYESIGITFSNDNSFRATGVWGQGNGSKNFFGITYNQADGPSRLFMLGLSNDVGRRALGVNVSDNFSQRNNLEFKTSKPLWEGARIDLNWKVGWSYQQSNTFYIDTLTGLPKASSMSKTATGSIDRTFLSLPSTFIFSFFKNGIKKVNELYQQNGGTTAQALSDAFVKGFETFPMLSKASFLNEFAKYIPRPNWHLQWDGLEKLSVFSGFTKKVSLEHTYSSSYSEGWKLGTDGATNEIQSQRISYGFGPLIGLSITFNSLWDGNLNGSIKYNTKNDYSLGASTQNITEAYTRDIGITAGFSKSGFEIPLFGVSLKNDVEFSFSYTNAKTSSVIYDMSVFKEEGTPQEVNTRTTIEPRVKYVISSKVTLSVFYKRTSQQPEGSSRLPATTTNEMGLDVNISIQ